MLKSISKGHRYLFYRIYQWNMHAFGEEGTPAFNALLQVSFIALFNFATFLLLIQIIGRLVNLRPSTPFAALSGNVF
jgi:hypothetical protein